MFRCHLLIVPLLFLSQVRCEVFTALADLQELLNTEAVLIHSLENYIRAEELKIDLLKRYADIYNKQHNKATEDVESYVANPLNAYTLVKRMTTDWQEVESLITTDVSKDYMANISYAKENMKFPTDEDLNGAAAAVIRLQDTYRLDTASLARGELNGVKYSSELTAADCFELGRQSYNNGDFYHTLLWMREADERLSREQNKTVDKGEILEYLAFSTYKEGRAKRMVQMACKSDEADCNRDSANITLLSHASARNINLALDLTNKLLEMVPTHERAKGNKVYYEEEIQKGSYKKKGDDETDDIITNEGVTIVRKYIVLSLQWETVW
ncbi:unnamed protein product [Acanthoscelides obtectus]|uniref:Prolyl 4-hydroxylase alpha-subunit N-terminal domain-containing protein n=1 Tax=Acanthoscelides obtectus TaxID=200917 RepID=A0A9P0KAG0_ACAOB|nr:unnamed protein product [Acanthoscelides obtectus]CAK1662361.1 Prolyl 4-hydroxylase subunit alpha-2 [Acanthoscelides obtectus]